MSIQVGKSTVSAQQSGGRRTPLSLTGAGSGSLVVKSSNKQVLSDAFEEQLLNNDKSTEATKTETPTDSSTENKEIKCSSQSQIQEKVPTEKTGKGGTSNDKKEKSGLKNSEKNSNENGFDSKKEKNTNGHQHDEDKKVVSEKDEQKSSGNRESLRQKEILKEKEQDKVMETEQKVDDSEKKEKEDSIKLKEDKNQEECLKEKKKQDKKSEKKESDSVSSKSEPIIEVDSNEEMEALVFEPDVSAPVSSTPGKILKLKKSPPQSVTLPSSSKSYVPAVTYSSTSTSTPDRHMCPTSYKSISGRRSLRPMKEYTFQSNFRESYRKINTELDVTSNTSMNVTVGSEVPNNSSFSFFGRGKKRERTPPAQMAVESQLDIDASPKRARLDFSGLLGIVSSPVLMLRARLSSVKLQSSTPNSKMQTKEEEEAVENVSGIAVEELLSKEIIDEDISIGQDAADDIEPLKDSDNKDMADIDIADEDVDLKKSEVVVIGDDNTNKRKMCNIM